MTVTSIDSLAVGDTVRIKYLMRSGLCPESEMMDRWIEAKIVDVSCDCWPVARLSDGQYSEIRPYMTWRLIRKLSSTQAGLRAA